MVVGIFENTVSPVSILHAGLISHYASLQLLLGAVNGIQLGLQILLFIIKCRRPLNGPFVSAIYYALHSF